MRVVLLATLVSVTVACTPAAGGPCKDLCRELVQGCDFRAYPDFASCEQGCAYNETEGADVPAQLACIQDAECDTFAIVECEHAYGAGSDD